jgi:hypothetical protein
MFWFLVGLAAGVSGYSWLKRTMSDLAEQITPGNLARAAGEQSVKVFGRAGRAFNAAVNELLSDGTPDVDGTRE